MLFYFCWGEVILRVVMLMSFSKPSNRVISLHFSGNLIPDMQSDHFQSVEQRGILLSLCFCSSSQQLCSSYVASYSLRRTIDGYAELCSSVQTKTYSDIFCIHSQNRKSSRVFLLIGKYDLLLQSNWQVYINVNAEIEIFCCPLAVCRC